MGGLERAGQVFEQAVKAARQRVPAGDQNIVIARVAIKGKDGRSGGAQPALGPVSRDRVPHLPARRHPDSQTVRFCTRLRRRRDFQGQRALAAPYAAGRAQKIGADPDAVQRKSL